MKTYKYMCIPMNNLYLDIKIDENFQEQYQFKPKYKPNTNGNNQ